MSDTFKITRAGGLAVHLMPTYHGKKLEAAVARILRDGPKDAFEQAAVLRVNSEQFDEPLIPSAIASQPPTHSDTPTVETKASELANTFEAALFASSVSPSSHRVADVFDAAVTPIRAAIEKRIASGHNADCGVNRKALTVCGWVCSPYPCTCGHADLLAAMKMMEVGK